MSHRDDDGVEYSCAEQEGAVVGSDDDGDVVACPECESRDIELCCGDHGYRCGECDATFTIC